MVGDYFTRFLQFIHSEYTAKICVVWVGRAYFNTFFFHTLIIVNYAFLENLKVIKCDIKNTVLIYIWKISHNIRLAFLFWHESLLLAANTDTNPCTSKAETTRAILPHQQTKCLKLQYKKAKYIYTASHTPRDFGYQFTIRYKRY